MSTSTQSQSSRIANNQTHSTQPELNIDVQVISSKLFDEDVRTAPLAEVMQAVVDEIDLMVGLDRVNTVTTGLEPSRKATDPLEAAINNTAAHDVEFDVFFYPWKAFLGDDDVDGKEQAKAKANRRRNEDLKNPTKDCPDADMMIRVTDGGYEGQQYTKQGLRGGTQYGVPVLTISVSDYIDWDSVNFDD